MGFWEILLAINLLFAQVDEWENEEQGSEVVVSD